MNSDPSIPASRDWSAGGNLWICLVLVSATLAVYSQVRHFGFINCDDPEYVSENPHLKDGVSITGIKWAVASAEDYWFPLTRLSYLLEYRFFGLESGWYHVTNLLLHVLASVLLFVFLLRATNARWPSAFVAFLFALHPLHVESVAWVSERKDVLGAVFWFLALWAWVRYAERPVWRRYVAALLLFAMGLMSKPMIVTLPFVLLLLDFWPLRRPFSRKLLFEKLPFLALSAGCSAITYLTQRNGGAVRSLHRFPFGLRIENALVTWIVYIARMFWPAGLAMPYPYPRQVSLWQAAAVALALACISALALRWFGKRPWLAVGWFWYLGTLVPVIGLIQVGVQASADRYMYVPMVGISIMLAWSAADAVRRRPRAARWITALAAGVLIALVPVAWLQLRYWKDSETLFRHSIAVTGGNTEAYLNLGSALADFRGRLPEAVSVLETGLQIDPGDEQLQTALGATLLSTNVAANIPAAVDHLRAALTINPGNSVAHANLAAASFRAGRPDVAADEARAALRISPDYGAAHYYLAAALFRQGNFETAIDEAGAALRIEPGNSEAHELLGSMLSREPGRLDEAIRQFREALRVRPDYVAAHVSLGLILSAIPGRRPEAIAHLEAALVIQPDPALRKTLEQLQSQTR